jgi:hypothetical protein
MPRLEARGGAFLEVELSGPTGATLAHVRGARDQAEKIRSRDYADEDEARWAMSKLVARHLRDGFAWAGPSQILPVAPPGAGDAVDDAPVLPESPSSLMLDEHFGCGDDRFLGEVLASASAARLAALAERWAKDERPWARRMLLAYLDDGCDRPHHKPLVKRLFKHAEAAGDDEAMAHFLAAFDRLGRRMLISLPHRQARLVLMHDRSVPGRLVVPEGRKPRESAQFSRATRRYLMRRALRYFRRLGSRDIERYRRAICLALPLYRDRALATPSRLLDAWGLMHTLYDGSPVLRHLPRGLRLAEGKSLGELRPAPQVAEAWQGEAGFAALLALVADARSRTVRGWAVALLREHHAVALGGLGLPEVRRLLASEHDEALRLGGELFGKLRGLELLRVDEWLELLAIPHLEVLAELARLAERALHPDRLTLAQCLELARAAPASVAALGVRWAQAKPIVSAAELSSILALGRLGVATARTAGVRWAIERLAQHPLASLEHVRELGDAPHRDARELLFAALVGAGAGAGGAGGAALARFAAEPALWFAFAESPYDDVRAVVLAHAARWRAEAPSQTLRHLWTTAVLAVHRGSAAKARVPRQLAERLAAHPEEAETLLPVLGLALRSVRPAERALAMGALARAVRADAALAARAQQLLPELTISDQVVQ